VRPKRCRRCIIAASLGGALPICRPTAFQLGMRSIIPAAGAQFAAVDPSRPLEAGLGKIVRGSTLDRLATYLSGQGDWHASQPHRRDPAC
jgi:hypothetical protein